MSYRRKYKASFKKHGSSGSIKSIVLYAILILLIVGAVGGAITANLMDSASYDSVKNFLSGFLASFDKLNINQKAAFLDALYKYFRLIFIVWLSGFFMPGVVVIGAMLFAKAFAYGFTTATLTKYFGFYGLIIGFNSYVPQNLFFLPSLIYVSYYGMLMIFNSKQPVKAHNKFGEASLLEYGFTLVIGLLCCIIAALIETFLTPSLLEYIKPV